MTEYNIEGDPDAKVEDFAHISPSDTAREIALVRYQIQRAINEGAPPSVIAQLSAVVGKLSREWTIAAVRSNQMIHVDEARRYLQMIAGEFARGFSDVPGAEERIDSIIARVAGMRNSGGQERQLLGRIR
jgi:hypothetical protein